MLRQACHGVKFHVERHVAHDLMGNETVGGRIAARRREVPRYAKSQERLAKDVGVARGTVSAWETDRFIPEGQKLARLAECLGVSRGWILAGGQRNGTQEDRDKLIIAGWLEEHARQLRAEAIRSTGGVPAHLGEIERLHAEALEEDARREEEIRTRGGGGG